MTPEEIKARATEVAALFVALANGKTLQFDTSPNQSRMNRWEDAPEELSLCIHSELSRWRVKPEPRRLWETPSASTFRTDSYVRTYHENQAKEWKDKGWHVTEWVEVPS